MEAESACDFLGVIRPGNESHCLAASLPVCRCLDQVQFVPQDVINQKNRARLSRKHPWTPHPIYFFLSFWLLYMMIEAAPTLYLSSQMKFFIQRVRTRMIDNHRSTGIPLWGREWNSPGLQVHYFCINDK